MTLQTPDHKNPAKSEPKMVSGQLLVSSIPLYSVTPISLFAVHSRAMGVPLEPGQKGINWSNIAVGERVMSRLSLCTYANARWYHEYGNLTTSL